MIFFFNYQNKSLQFSSTSASVGVVFSISQDYYLCLQFILLFLPLQILLLFLLISISMYSKIPLPSSFSPRCVRMLPLTSLPASSQLY